MNYDPWMIWGGGCLLVLVGAAYVWLQMPLYRWGCRQCKKIVTVSRFHPGRCTCGSNTLAAFFCGDCGSWNTLPNASRHCVACSSRNVLLGAEYNFGTQHVKIRNRNSQRSLF
jgi:hypothetical protein